MARLLSYECVALTEQAAALTVASDHPGYLKVTGNVHVLISVLISQK
jgi:hypothetical protein